jgi:hypothetical protein
MANTSSKQQLLGFLSKRVWDPVIKAKLSRYEEADEKLLRTVQEKTKTQKARYQSYKSAGELRQEFQDDLRSAAAKKVNSGLKKLDLPIQADVADEFFELADKLGVEPERKQRSRRASTKKSTNKSASAKKTPSKRRPRAKHTTKGT